MRNPSSTYSDLSALFPIQGLTPLLTLRNSSIPHQPTVIFADTSNILQRMSLEGNARPPARPPTFQFQSDSPLIYFLFLRIESKYSATASNTFKLAKFHALFFPLGHHPLKLNYSVLVDLFVKTSQEWFQSAYKLDPTQR